MYLINRENFRGARPASWRFQGNRRSPPGGIVNPVLMQGTGGGTATTKIPARDMTSRLTRSAARTAAIAVAAPARHAAHHAAAGTGGDGIGLCPHVPVQNL
jgi:hypothetical protein